MLVTVKLPAETPLTKWMWEVWHTSVALLKYALILFSSYFIMLINSDISYTLHLLEF